MGCWEGGCSSQGDHYNGAGLRAAGRGCSLRAGSPQPGLGWLLLPGWMDGGTGMPTAGGGGRRCPVFPLWVMAPGLDPTMHPLGWDGVSLSPPCGADSTTGQILLEHLPSCDTGQGHLHVPRANCVSPCGTGPLCPLHLNAWGGGLDPSLLSGGSQKAPPPKTYADPPTPPRAPVCCKQHPKP